MSHICGSLLLCIAIVSCSSVFCSLLRDTSSKEQLLWLEEGKQELDEALQVKQNTGIAKNVILFVGDGMGPNTITASRIYKSGEGSHLVFEKFPHVGLLKTYAVDKRVPDSACTATALFSGVKTNFEVVGVDSGVKLRDCPTSLVESHRIKNIMKMGQEAGKDTGFVTNTRVTHATPSALYSYSAERRWECDGVMTGKSVDCKDIARQLIEDEPGKHLKVIMGGGRQSLTWNISASDNDPIDKWSCQRKDERDLISTWRQDKQSQGMNCKYVQNTGQLRAVDVNSTDCVLGIFANGHMNLDYKRDTSPAGQPSLTEMTETAINIMKRNPKGYILVVEGGLIDQAHHRGHAKQALSDTLAFEAAVDRALNLTLRSDTLVVVTSDHAHSLNINGYSSRDVNILGIGMNSKQDGVPFTTLTYSIGGPNNYQYIVENEKVKRKDPTLDDTTDYEYSQQSGILNDETIHGGVDVPVFAVGPMAHLFHNVHEQSYVAHVISYSARLGNYKDRPVFNKSAGCSISYLLATVLLLLHLSRH